MDQDAFWFEKGWLHFQRMIDQILGNIPHVFVYVDEVLITSPNAESHLYHVHQFLTVSASMVSGSTQPSVISPSLRLSILV